MVTVCFKCRFMKKLGCCFVRGYYCGFDPPWVADFVTGRLAYTSCYMKNLGECPDYQPALTWKERVMKFEDKLMGKTE